MNKKIFLPRIIFAVFMLSMLLNGLFIPTANVEAKAYDALTAYNRDAAVNWANSNNYNDGRYWGEQTHRRWCTTYVTKAMQAGGIGVPVYDGNGALATWLRAHTDMWEIRPKEQLEKGDILFLNKTASIPDNLNISYMDHVVFITAPGTYSAWNAERINKKFAWFAGVFKYEKGVHFKVSSPVAPIWVNGKSYALKSANDTNLVLDLEGGKIADGSRILQWGYHGGLNQVWKMEAFANGYYRLHSALNYNYCIVVQYASRDNGGKMALYRCSPNGQDNEWWKPIKVGNNVAIQNMRSGKVMDVPGGSHTWGTQIIQWNLHYGANQQWISILK